MGSSQVFLIIQTTQKTWETFEFNLLSYAHKKPLISNRAFSFVKNNYSSGKTHFRSFDRVCRVIFQSCTSNLTILVDYTRISSNLINRCSTASFSISFNFDVSRSGSNKLMAAFWVIRPKIDFLIFENGTISRLSFS